MCKLCYFYNKTKRHFITMSNDTFTYTIGHVRDPRTLHAAVPHACSPDLTRQTGGKAVMSWIDDSMGGSHTIFTSLYISPISSTIG